ncbi:MAG: zinc-dependent metalloprotease [Gemmatimonadaceae bacterium]|nr:zinc-dependent metalloprotease [Gemmatimonadaceae bacterium]
MPFLASARRALLALVAAASLLGAQQAAPLIGLRVDADRNKLFLEIPTAQLDQDLLHQMTLATGIGVSQLGLDRGQLGGADVIRFERRGRRILLVKDNWSARAPAGDAAAQRAVAEAFPRGIAASFAIESEADGRIVVDATSYFLSDLYGIADGVRRAQQGSARVDANRSWFDETRTRAFPRNAEIHAVLTFNVDNPGFALRRAAAEASAPVFEIHHSLVALPAREGFRPREADPRSGFFGTGFLDFSQGYDGTYRAGFADRWRLVPKDPAAYQRGQLVEPENPIIYYLDPAIPEPYRSAFREGGNWWGKVFEAAGFRNAFQVLDLPAGADPMDARYNLIYWVHRNAPGPSVGPSFSDPRTGEILRTVVRMDSYRSLIDYNIWAGLVPAAGPRGLNMNAEQLAMARRRQHTAHEIGHTLGLSHNFIAATNDRSSVMDYPVPMVTVDAQGQLDLSKAYAPFAGAWDSLAIRWGYTWYPNERAEREGLARIVAEGQRRNLRFVADQHAGADGSIPGATRWVEGRTMFDAVDRTVAVRRVAMEKFDERAIQPGEPMYLLSMRFTHVYLHHRYSLEGLVKYLGGMDFRYAMRGDGQVPTTVIPGAEQRRALTMALDALEPSQLAIPERVLALIPPVPPGGDGQMDWIERAGTTVDQQAMAGGLATEVIEGLMERNRLQRVVIQHARNPQDMPTLMEVLQTIVDRTWFASAARTPNDQALRRAVQRVVLNTMLDRAGDQRAAPDVRQVTAMQLKQLAERLAAVAPGGPPADQALRESAVREIAAFFDGDDDPAKRSRFTVIPLPWP